MDKIIDQIGNEAGPHVTLRRLAEDRKKLEALSPPEKKNRFHEWKLQREEEFKAQMKTIAYGMVGQASRDIASVYSEEGLVDHTLKNIEKEQLKVAWPSVMLSYLPLLVAALEDACYGKEREAYDQRFREIDRSIANVNAVIKKPFNPELINTDSRFPIDRIGQTSDGKFYDKWLSDGLKSKAIFFEPREKYIDALCRYYHEVYWATAEKEREEKEKAVPPPVTEEKPTFLDDDVVNPQAAAISEFHRMGDLRGEPGLSWSKSRIYKGGAK